MRLEDGWHSSGVQSIERKGLGFGYLVRTLFDLFLDVCFGIIEFTYATAQATHQLRDLLASEHEKYNDQNNDDLIGTQHTQQKVLYHKKVLNVKYNNK